MDILDFLEETADYWDPAEFKKADEDAQKLSADAWIKKYSKAIMANKDMAADFYNLKNSKPLPERLRGSFGDMQFNPSDAWKQQIYQSEYKDVPRDEFERQLKAMKDYYDQEIARQDSIQARAERQKEVEKWNLAQELLSSDYAKQRYIEDPKSSLFGKQAPKLGEAENTRWGAIGDLAAGVGGGVADFIPPAWLVGPAIRAGRDLAYYNTPYGKSLGDIFKDAAVDAGINKGARWLNNATREAKAAQRSASPEVTKALNVRNETENIKKGLGTMTFTNGDDIAIKNTIEGLPESSLKNDLMPLVSNITNKPVDRDAISEVITKYYLETNPECQRAGKAMLKNPNAKRSAYVTKSSPYFEKAITSTPFSELPLKDKGSYLWNIIAGKVNAGNPGQVAVQELANVRGRGSNVSYNDQEGFEERKEMYKKNFGESWLKYGELGFKPKDNDDPAAIAAYKEIMGIK